MIMQNRDAESLSEVLEFFVNYVETARPGVSSISSDEEMRSVKTYVFGLAYVCEQIGLPFPYNDKELVLALDESVNEVYEEVEIFVKKRRIDLQIVQSNVFKKDRAALDNNRKTKIHSYCNLIREIVGKSSIKAPLRDSILNKLNIFAAEVDRGNTRVESASAILVSVCEAVSAGATALTPALRLLERITGALARLTGPEAMLSLPAPDDFGLANEQDVASE